MSRQTVALDIAQTSTIASALLVVVLAAIAALVALGVYRVRNAAVRDNVYRELAERTTAAELKTAEAMQANVGELQALREGLQAARGELQEVRHRLAALEKLLSQIG